MSASGNVLLLTGNPGIGKTTVIKKVIKRFPELPMAGFYTEEIRVRNARQGFALVTFRGERFTIAHTGIRSEHRVGKYGVAVDTIDTAVAMALDAGAAPKLYIIDEIGRMECFSLHFLQRMTALLGSGKLVVATVAMKGGGFIAEVKNRQGGELWEVIEKNRDAMPGKVASWIRERLP